jgi:ferredoxin
MFGDRRQASRHSSPDSPGCCHTEAEAKVEFYVTEDCNGCGLCKRVAPDFFDCIEFAYSYFMVRQPQTTREVELLRSASSLCALDAICETIKVQA